VVVCNGRETFADPGLDGIFPVHIGDIPTIPVAVNFGWYALRSPGSILVKLDNDVVPPESWEEDILEKSFVADLGGFLCANEFEPTPVITVRGQCMRQPHRSQTWGMAFVYGGAIWLAPELAELLQYEDERFVRSDDGDLGERASRVPGATVAYSADCRAVHLSPGPLGSTESPDLVREMYEACDLLIKALPARAIRQDTIWSQVLSREDAAGIVTSRGVLPDDMARHARRLLRAKLDEAFALVGRSDLAAKIFEWNGHDAR
jgi:hypothetical protein